MALNSTDFNVNFVELAIFHYLARFRLRGLKTTKSVPFLVCDLKLELYCERTCHNFRFLEYCHFNETDVFGSSSGQTCLEKALKKIDCYVIWVYLHHI